MPTRHGVFRYSIYIMHSECILSRNGLKKELESNHHCFSTSVLVPDFSFLIPLVEFIIYNGPAPHTSASVSLTAFMYRAHSNKTPTQTLPLATGSPFPSSRASGLLGLHADGAVQTNHLPVEHGVLCDRRHQVRKLRRVPQAGGEGHLTSQEALHLLWQTS